MKQQKVKAIVDVELDTLEQCLRWLWQLEPDARRRVLDYLEHRDQSEREARP